MCMMDVGSDFLTDATFLLAVFGFSLAVYNGNRYVCQLGSGFYFVDSSCLYCGLYCGYCLFDGSKLDDDNM